MGVGVFKVQRPGEQAQASGMGSLLGTVGQIGGGIVGGIYGGPHGAMAGSTAGGMAGGMIGKAIQPDKPATQGSKDLSVGVSDDNAMARKKAAMDAQPERQIADSIDSLKYLPPEQQQEYAQPLMQAQEMARKNRGMA
jgi:outer membrane lipoprotein SlyB